MSAINNAGNLQRSSVKPLRPSTAAARKGHGAQSFDVETLRKGGTLDLGGMVGGPQEAAATPQLLKEKLQAPKAHESSRQKANARLSAEEKREKLEKIHNASQQYETMYIDHFLKQMRQSPFAKMPGGELYQDIAEMPLRDHLSRSAGLGLSSVITEQVARQEGLDQFLHDNPGIAGPGYRPTTLKTNMSKSPGELSMGAGELAQILARSQQAAVELVGGARRQSLEDASQAMAQEPRTHPAKDSQEAKIATVGLMTDEEIAYLYEDARSSML